MGATQFCDIERIGEQRHVFKVFKDLEIMKEEAYSLGMAKLCGGHFDTKEDGNLAPADQNIILPAGWA